MAQQIWQNPTATQSASSLFLMIYKNNKYLCILVEFTSEQNVDPEISSAFVKI